jgi:hypothetical protein
VSAAASLSSSGAVRAKTDAKPAAGAAKKVSPLSYGVVTRVKDGVAFARDLGFASFGELVIFVPSPARLKAMQASAGSVNYVDGMIVGLEKDLTSVVILGNERLVKVRGGRVVSGGHAAERGRERGRGKKGGRRFSWGGRQHAALRAPAASGAGPPRAPRPQDGAAHV